MTPRPAPIARIEREHRVQERLWAAERVAWAAMALILGAAMAGVFGDGPLARVERAAPDGSLRVAFQRFQRADAPTRIGFIAGPGVVENGRMHLCLSRAFLEEWQIDRFEPDPERETAAPDGLCFALRVEAAAPGDEQPEVGLWVAPRTARFPADGAVHLAGRAPADLSAWVWP